MQIEINNELAAEITANATGFASVQEFVNCLIKRESDLLAIQKGIADAEAGNLTPLAEFDQEFRDRNGFAAPSDA